MAYLLAKTGRTLRLQIAREVENMFHINQEMVLVHLWEQEGLTQSELADRIDVDVSTLTKALQRMERSHLVHRRPDTDDGRVSRVYLTERGRALEQPIVALWQELDARAFAGLTPVERDLLRRVLVQVRQNLVDDAP
jgi:DNA-binding MarR family transcriptional regulator